MSDTNFLDRYCLSEWNDYIAFHVSEAIALKIFPSPDDAYSGWQKEATRNFELLKEHIQKFILNHLDEQL